MSKKIEIDKWREKARKYREEASSAASLGARRMLEDLARGAEALAEDLSKSEGVVDQPNSDAS